MAKYRYALWQTDRHTPRKISVAEVPEVANFAKLNQATVELQHNPFSGGVDFNFLAYTDKPINKTKLYGLFISLKKQAVLRGLMQVELTAPIPKDFF